MKGFHDDDRMARETDTRERAMIRREEDARWAPDEPDGPCSVWHGGQIVVPDYRMPRDAVRLINDTRLAEGR